MHMKHSGSMTILAAALAALAVGAAPALAGEDDDGDDDDASSTQPTQVTSGSSGSEAGSTVPQGGVATGAGGTAVQGPDTLLALASGALVLIASGGGMVAVARRRES
jgi:hypothetical protein